MAYENLFKPGKIGNLELKNRIVMSGIGTTQASVWGEVTDDVIDWYVARARGGAGLIIVQAAVVATAVDTLRIGAKMLRADDECYGPRLRDLVDAIHENGSRAAIQLNPGGGAQARFGPWMPGTGYAQDVPPVGPSTVASPKYKRKPRELTVAEIRKIVELCGKSAALAKRAGFDVVEVQAHSGFLIGQFLSPFFNRRTDRYGGSLNNRARFFLEIVESTRKYVGSDYPVIARYAIDECWEGGLELAEGVQVARRLEEAGVDGIDVSYGIHGSRRSVIEPVYSEEGYLLPISVAVKEKVSIPTITSGRLGNPALAERALREGKTDFVGLARPLIADPDWPRKVMSGRVKEIRNCIVCNTCIAMGGELRSIRCAVNPTAGRERRYGEIKPAEKAKKVLVIGAGSAGMEAARVAALRGHKVTLFEKTPRLGGGQLRLAATPPHKETFRGPVNYYSAAFAGLGNLTVKLGKEVTPADVVKAKPDVVIVATGGTPCIPPIQGIDSGKVVTAFDVLAGKARVGNRVVIAGGGAVGCETANFLAHRGKDATVVEMLDAAGTGMEWRNWTGLEDELARGGVKIKTGLRVTAVTDRGVNSVDKGGHKTSIAADTVVLAIGVNPENRLARQLEGKVKELHVIGDAKAVRDIREAVSEGYVTAYNI